MAVTTTLQQIKRLARDAFCVSKPLHLDDYGLAYRPKKGFADFMVAKERAVVQSNGKAEACFGLMAAELSIIVRSR